MKYHFIHSVSFASKSFFNATYQFQQYMGHSLQLVIKLGSSTLKGNETDLSQFTLISIQNINCILALWWKLLCEEMT
jgi:hypothetical protein